MRRGVRLPLWAGAGAVTGAVLALEPFGCAPRPPPVPSAGHGANDTTRGAPVGSAPKLGRDPAAPVAGILLEDTTMAPLAGRSIVIGSGSTMTDELGRFTVPNVPSTYDLVIVDPDGTTVSLYRGLRRRDPLVRHHKGNSNDKQVSPQMAKVTGTLTGGPAWPLSGRGIANVLVTSSLFKATAALGGNLPPPLAGPSFGPLYLRWDGPPSLGAEVYAWSFTREGADAGAADAATSPSFAYGRQPLTLHPGDVSVTVPLQTVTRSAHLTGTIVHPPGSSPSQRSVVYALPHSAGARIYLAGDAPRPRAEPSFDFTVPLPEVPGASLCFWAFSSTNDVRLPVVWDILCGLTPGTPITAELQAPPKFTSPDPDSTVGPTTPLAWTPFDRGVYRLELVAGHFPTAANPNVYVYTSSTETTWPDLSSIGVPFPADAQYDLSIVGLGVFASIDELTGPTGFAAALTPEFRQSYLSPRKVKVTRP